MIERMRLHATLIVANLFISSRHVHCVFRPLGSVSDHQRRDDLSDDVFTLAHGDEASPFAISSGDGLALFADEDHSVQDESSSEGLNNFEPFITDSSGDLATSREKISQGSPCSQSLGKRDGSENDMILGKY